MQIEIKASRIGMTPHCDDPACKLGKIKFSCPCCETTIVDAQAYDFLPSIHLGAMMYFHCTECDGNLVLVYSIPDVGFVVFEDVLKPGMSEEDAKTIYFEE